MFTHSSIIQPASFSLLEKLMTDEEFSNFYLAGGTSLALQIGHRYSIDLDLFTNKPFNVEALQLHLNTQYLFETDLLATNTIKGFINNIKCDFIRHGYSFVEALKIEKNIRLASLKDIAAMKLSAIAQNGSRYKDFIDIFYLLEKMCLSEMLSAFQIKYPNSNILMAIKGLCYFEDINFDSDKPILLAHISFADVKNRIVDAVKYPEKMYT